MFVLSCDSGGNATCNIEGVYRGIIIESFFSEECSSEFTDKSSDISCITVSILDGILIMSGCECDTPPHSDCIIESYLNYDLCNEEFSSCVIRICNEDFSSCINEDESDCENWKINGNTLQLEEIDNELEGGEGCTVTRIATFEKE